MKTLASSIQRFVREDDGVTMVEYGLIAALVSIVTIVALGAVGTQLDVLYDRIAVCLTGNAAC